MVCQISPFEAALPLTSTLLTLAASDGIAESAVSLCVVNSAPPSYPAIVLDWSGSIGEFDCSAFADSGQEALAEACIYQSVRYLHGLLPFRIRALDNSGFVAAIKTVQIGRLTEHRRMITGSSPDAPRVVRLAANWATVDARHVAGVMLHEAVHQLLYSRELLASPVRRSSIGYSPWKFQERTGRLVWHGFWTFAVQVSFLLETLEDSSDQSYREIAEDFARLECCVESLDIFRLLSSSSENIRAKEGVDRLREALLKRLPSERFLAALSQHRAKTAIDFNAWAAKLVARHGSKNTSNTLFERVT